MDFPRASQIFYVFVELYFIDFVCNVTSITHRDAGILTVLDLDTTPDVSHQ